MREYGKLHTSFWTSKTIRALTDDGKTLAAYLLTCPHGNIIGAFRLPAGYVCDDLGWTLERFKKGFKTLEEHGFAIYCRDSGWVCVVKYLKWNPLENPNQRKAADRMLLSLPDTCFSEGLRKGCGTLTEQATAEATAKATAAAEAGGGKPPAESVDFSAIVSAYHEALPNCAQVHTLTDKRKKQIRDAETYARRICKERGWPYDLTFWKDFFRECAQDPWMAGNVPNKNNPAWKQSLDVLLRDEHFGKTMDRALAGIEA